MYTLRTEICYHSPRFCRWVTVPAGYVSDGASGAIDIWSESWWVHDRLCERGTWDDGTPATNWQASLVLHDILRQEKRHWRAMYWFLATWLFGCRACRHNGMWPWSTP